jgi:murein DD-endopeptidase MepM/ murein hydrolase activator NlpD
MRRWLVIGIFSVGLLACRHRANPYENAGAESSVNWKQVGLPFQSGVSFLISQGAFGKNSHHQKGIEYRWDFDVPYGTPVIAVDDGVVYAVNVPGKGGGCDSKYSEVPNTLLVTDTDGTVAQYTHIDSKVSKGDAVNKGDVIAVTSKNGFICTPQLDFLIFKSEDNLYGSPNQQSVPLRFLGLPNERATEGLRFTVP